MIGTNDVNLDYDLAHAHERLDTLVSMIVGETAGHLVMPIAEPAHRGFWSRLFN